MKTRQELEQMFDEEFDLWIIIWENNRWEYEVNNQERVKQFIFETIIPEVLKNILWNKCQSFMINNWHILKDENWDTAFFWRDAIIKKVKELYWIDL